MGEERATHAFARVSIGDAVAHTAVAWQSTAPLWDEKLAFKCVVCNHTYTKCSLLDVSQLACNTA